MTISKERVAELTKQFGKNEKDSGAAEVQVAILTERINALTGHLSSRKRDHATRRGLLGMVSRRRSLLDYLRKRSPERYVDVINKLNIRK
ncbi:MAG: 30S ribosomal protein S15 [Planctomycetota bacterium]|jgi:small subunit ribosomal protein S15|nr:30S ribosomal protein S15 [Blastopirellula sp.]